MKKSSIKFKIIFSVLVVILFFGILATLSVFYGVRSELIKSQETDLVNTVNHTADEVSLQMNDILTEAKKIASLEELNNFLVKKSSKVQDPNILHLIENYELNSNYLAIYVLDADGTAVVSTDETFLNKNFSFRDYFKSSQNRKPYIDTAIGVISQQLGYYFAEPVVSDSGEFLGVVVVKTAPKIIDDILKGNVVGGTYMFTEKNGVIVSSNKSERIFKSVGPLSAEENKNIEETKKFFTLKIEPIQYQLVKDKFILSENTQLVKFFDVDDNEEEILGLTKLHGSNFYLVIEQDYEAILGAVVKFAFLISVFVLAAALIAFLVLFLIIRRFLKPLEYFKESIAEVSKGNFKSRVPLKGGKEIIELASSFNEMIDAVIESRKEIDKRVIDQTKEIQDKALLVDNQNKAILNVMEDIEIEKEKTEAILHSIGDAVFVVDLNKNIVLVNEITERMSGFKKEEMLGRPYQEALNFIFESTGQINDEFVSKAIATGEIQKMANHTMLVRKDGVKVAVADSASPLKSKDGKILGCVVVFRDVTIEKEIDKAKTEFVSLAAHQLKTPVGAVNWDLEMLLGGDYGELSKEQREVLSEVYYLNQRMTELVTDFLNVSRIELGTLVVQPVPTDLKSICENVLSEMKSRIEKKNHEIVKNYDPNLPEFLADPKLTRIIFQNFISNAIKYTKENGHITINLKKEGDKVLISVANNGIPILESEQSKIFSKLYRTDSALEMDPDGNGLGLYVVKEIVEKAGGKIWFQSAEGKETVFYAEFPASGMLKQEGKKV